MSVPVPKRNPGELEVNTLARQLCVHTLRVTGNQKIFTPDQADFTSMIRMAAIDIHVSCWQANNIKVGASALRYKDRIELEAHAGDTCNRLYALIEAAKPLFHLSSRKVVYWQGLVVKVRNCIRGWYDGDVHRLKPGKG